MRDVLSQVTMFIAPSRFIRDRFVQFGIDPSRISVREIGVPAAQPATEPARESAPRTPGTSAPVVVGFLGSLLPSKAPHLLFEAAALLPPDSIRIEIAGAFAAYHGDTSYEAAFRRAAAAPAPGPATSPALMRGPLARDEAQSVLRGPLGRNEVSAFLGGLDVLVVPSIWPENSPLVIREAFAVGVPVVASRIGGIPEMVDDGRNGLLVEPGDSADLARVLKRLIDEPALLDGLRRHLPGPIPTMETDVAALRALYGEVIGRADAGTRWATDTPTAGGRDQEVWASGPPVGPLAHPQGPLTQAPGSLPLRTAWAAGPPMDPRAAGPPPGATGPNREIDSPRVAWAAGPPIDAGAAGPPMDACAAGPPIDAGAADPPTAVAGPHTRAEAPTIIAVVLNYKTPDDTWLAVRSLLLSDRRVDHIVVVDNDDTSAKSAAPAGSSRTLSAPETLAGASPALVLPPSDGNRITHIAPGRNVGFAGGVNLGINAALARGAERIFLLNSDALIGRHTLAGLERALNDAPNAGITAPVILDRRNPDCVASAGISFNRATGRMRNENFPGAGGGAAGGAGGAGASVREVDAASGCALLITRDTFERVGLFDEDYFFSFEDVDFCARAADAGIHTVVTTEATVLHEGGRSIGAASPERLYFGARNQLLAARRRNRDASGLTTALRATFIVGLNVAHAFRARGGSLPSRLLAVARGSLDYARCRLGDPRDRLGDARG